MVTSGPAQSVGSQFEQEVTEPPSGGDYDTTIATKVSGDGRAARKALESKDLGRTKESIHETTRAFASRRMKRGSDPQVYFHKQDTNHNRLHVLGDPISDVLYRTSLCRA